MNVQIQKAIEVSKMCERIRAERGIELLPPDAGLGFVPDELKSAAEAMTRREMDWRIAVYPGYCLMSLTCPTSKVKEPALGLPLDSETFFHYKCPVDASDLYSCFNNGIDWILEQLKEEER